MAPNFFILGTPKSGTSSLFDWLSDHPDVLASTPKETHYFLDRDHPLLRPINFHNSYIQGIDEYFSGREGTRKIVMEGSIHHFFQETALQQIPCMKPLPKALVVLREPAERIYSSFNYSLNNIGAVKANLTFSKFVDHLLSDTTSVLDDVITAPSSKHVLKNELRYSYYAFYLRTWQQALGTNMKAILFEELMKDKLKMIREICVFLNIDPDFYNSYNWDRQNKTVKIRNHHAHRLLKVFSQKRFPFKKTLKKVYYRLQSSGRETPEADRIALLRLRKYFEEPNKELTQLGVDTRIWQNVVTDRK